MATKHQEMAIRNKMSKEEKSDNEDEDAVAGKHKQNSEKHKGPKQRISGDGDKKIGKCKHCGK